ncbi:MAG: hypothetical protein JWN30_1227 [Bacilli bacterium]|nr:hypothetical protein [Bacilli bacterium]
MKVNLTAEGILTGVGVILAAAVLLPMVESVSRPLAQAGVQGVVLLGNRVKGGVALIKEEVEDLVAEAQFERMRKSIDRDMK